MRSLYPRASFPARTILFYRHGISVPTAAAGWAAEDKQQRFFFVLLRPTFKLHLNATSEGIKENTLQKVSFADNGAKKSLFQLNVPPDSAVGGCWMYVTGQHPEGNEEMIHPLLQGGGADGFVDVSERYRRFQSLAAIKTCFKWNLKDSTGLLLFIYECSIVGVICFRYNQFTKNASRA